MSARDGAAYGLGVAISMAEVQATHNAKNIVMDCLNTALTFANSLENNGEYLNRN